MLGIPYEGVKLLDPVTYAPPLAAPAPEGSIYYRSGADEGPAAIRRHSVFYSLRHGRGFIPEVDRDLVIEDQLRVVDYGDVAVAPADVELTFLRAHEKLADIIAAGAVPIVLGGDHSIPVPVLQVLAGKLNGKLGIVAFDSHFDLSYEPKYWAGSQWARAFDLGVVEPRELRADRHPRRCASRCTTVPSPRSSARTTTRWPTSTRWASTPSPRRRSSRRPAGTEAMYISLDIDVVDPAHGGQKYPDPAGLSARELLRALRVLCRGPHRRLRHLLPGASLRPAGPPEPARGARRRRGDRRGRATAAVDLPRAPRPGWRPGSRPGSRDTCRRVAARRSTPSGDARKRRQSGDIDARSISSAPPLWRCREVSTTRREGRRRWPP